MAVTATGILAGPLELLAELVAASSTFQTWTGTADATAARARVHVISVGEAEIDLLERPFALVRDTGAGRVDEGGFHSGELLLFFEADVSPANAESGQDAAYEFLNNVGAILTEMRTAVTDGTVARLAVRNRDGLTVDSEIMRSDPKEEPDGADYFRLRCRVRFGPA